MQDRYSGDIGDFGKLGLLRHLVRGGKFTLGVNWYLFPDEGHTEDGKFTSYLTSSAYKRCDPELHEKLEAVVSEARSVAALEAAEIFDVDSAYYSASVDFFSEHPGGSHANKMARLQKRKDWLSDAVSRLSCNSGSHLLYAELVFLERVSYS